MFVYSAEGIMVEEDNGGGLLEGIMRYYLGRDYQVDLFTTRCPWWIQKRNRAEVL